MRISVDRSDPGFGPGVWGSVVYLDGVVLKRVITADEERGVVLVHAVDSEGCVRINEARTETVKEWRAGAVRIDLPAAYWRFQ